MRNVGRLTTPIFGLGLVDAMPDSFFDGLVAAEPASTRGVVNRGQIAIPNPGDPTQSVGSTRVTRFGWKAGVPSLMQFSADAYVNEMGITTQSCFRGAALTAFAVESAPNGVPVSANCDDRAPRQTRNEPGRRPHRDAVGPGRRRRRLVRQQPHRDPGRRVPVRGVHDGAGAGARATSPTRSR